MDLLGVAAIIVACGGLVTVGTTSYLQIRAQNRMTVAVKTLVPVVVETKEKVEAVHTLTNSNYEEQKQLNAALQGKLDALTAASAAADLLALSTAQRLLEEARADNNRLNVEVNRLNANATPPSESVQPVRVVVEPDEALPVTVVDPPKPPTRRS